MTDRRLRGATALLALAGAAIAAYLSYTRLTDTSIICPTTGCGAVQRSEYAELGGVPVAYLGVLGYLAIALTATTRRFGAALVVCAAGFATYLLVAQLALIHAVCVWCLGSDVVAYSLLVVAGVRLYPGRRNAPVPPHDLRLPDERSRQRADQGHAGGARAG